MKQNAKNGNLDQIWEEMERRLIVMRYSKASVKHYKRIVGWVTIFLEGYGEQDYSKEMGRQFIAEYRLQENHYPWLFDVAKIVVRRMDEILENKVFTPCFQMRKLEPPTRFTECLDAYLDALLKRGYSESTIKNHRRYAGQLLARLPDTVLSLANLTAAELYNIFTQRCDLPHGALAAAKGLLIYLYENGVTKTNLSVCVPAPRRIKALPSVYSSDEVARLLSAVDRTTGTGKRDYAYLMIASHMGLRSSDIVNLTFNDIDHKGKTIDIIQVKTQNPLTLVMNSDVEDAIIDYIQNGRPQMPSEKIFIGSKAPYAPITAANGYEIVHRHMKLAGIAALGRRCGPQALRQSYATALVSKGVPYAVVKEALGHEDPESAKHYVRVDTKRLKPCAIDVPVPVGTFAMMIGDLEGVL